MHQVRGSCCVLQLGQPRRLSSHFLICLAVRQATEGLLLQTSVPTVRFYILVAIQYSAKCLHRPLMRWAGAVNRGQASEAPCSYISHSRLSPLLCLTSLSGRRLTLTAHSSELTTKSRLGPKSPGTSQVLAAALSTSLSDPASCRCGVRSEGCEPCHGVR